MLSDMTNENHSTTTAAASSREVVAAAVAAYKERTGFAVFRPRAVLFDMDGVLFDSMPNHARSWAQVCTEFGLDMSPEEAFLHEGRTGNATINILTQRYWKRNATPEEIEQIYKEKCRLFNACPEAQIGRAHV